MKQLLWDLFAQDANEHGLPPGFRFHPTDEELVTFYLASKVFNGGFGGVQIVEVDLNRCEPWDLPEMAKMGEREWYFYSLRDRKYPTGLRTNRATGSGYWKATGKDREVCSAATGALVGMKKTLVFYMGRAPRGEKTKWVLHEYRLDSDLSYRDNCKEEWVICRIFHKAIGEKKNPFHHPHAHAFFAAQPPLPLPSPTASLLFPASEGLILQPQGYYGYDPLVAAPAGCGDGLLQGEWGGRAAETVGPQWCGSKEPWARAELQEEAVLHCDDMIGQTINVAQSPFIFDVGLFHPSIFAAAGAVPDVMPFGSEPLII